MVVTQITAIPKRCVYHKVFLDPRRLVRLENVRTMPVKRFTLNTLIMEQLW